MNDDFPLYEIPLHGHRVSYRMAGEGPPLVLIHGITSTSETWREVMSALAEHHTVVAPDLMGHGDSAKPRGDYSLGSHASGVRDLLIALGLDGVTVVGHSLGGGVAMQFAYQFPERTERLVLVSSGGLGHEVHMLLRAASLPGSELVLPVIAAPLVRDVGIGLGRLLGRASVRPGPDLAEIARGYGSLAEAGARQAFVHTLRAVIDPLGQRVSARDRLYLASEVPTLIMWGGRDPIIPVEHGRDASELIPNCRFEVFKAAGHFPHLEEPRRFVRVLKKFVAETEPAEVEIDRVRERVLEEAGIDEDQIPGARRRRRGPRAIAAVGGR